MNEWGETNAEAEPAFILPQTYTLNPILPQEGPLTQL